MVFPLRFACFLEFTLESSPVSAKLAKSLKTTSDWDFRACEELISAETNLRKRALHQKPSPNHDFYALSVGLSLDQLSN